MIDRSVGGLWRRSGIYVIENSDGETWTAFVEITNFYVSIIFCNRIKLKTINYFWYFSPHQSLWYFHIPLAHSCLAVDCANKNNNKTRACTGELLPLGERGVNFYFFVLSIELLLRLWFVGHSAKLTPVVWSSADLHGLWPQMAVTWTKSRVIVIDLISAIGPSKGDCPRTGHISLNPVP